jgi:hypothetical protein
MLLNDWSEHLLRLVFQMEDYAASHYIVKREDNTALNEAIEDACRRKPTRLAQALETGEDITHEHVKQELKTFRAYHQALEDIKQRYRVGVKGKGCRPIIYALETAEAEYRRWKTQHDKYDEEDEFPDYYDDEFYEYPEDDEREFGHTDDIIRHYIVRIIDEKSPRRRQQLIEVLAHYYTKYDKFPGVGYFIPCLNQVEDE